MDPSIGQSVSYRWNNDILGWQRLDAEGFATGKYSINELSGGRFYQAGTAVIDETTNRIIGNVATSRGSYLEYMPDGRLRINNVIPTESIAQASYRNAQISGAADFDIALANNQTLPIRGAFFELTATGSSVYYNPTLPWADAFREILNGPEGLEAREAALREGYMLADPQDVLERAMIGYLVTRGRALILDAIQRGLINDVGDYIIDFSEAATYIASVYADSVVLESSTLLA